MTNYFITVKTNAYLKFCYGLVTTNFFALFCHLSYIVLIIRYLEKGTTCLIYCKNNGNKKLYIMVIQK